MYINISSRPYDENGKHNGLKIRRDKTLAGSNPVTGI